MPKDDTLPMVIGRYRIQRRGKHIELTTGPDDFLIFSVEDAFHVGMALAAFAAVVNGKPFPPRDDAKDFRS